MTKRRSWQFMVWATALFIVALAAGGGMVRTAGGMTPAQGHVAELARLDRELSDINMAAVLAKEAGKRAKGVCHE
jgi:hypothetical protein